MFKWQFGNLAMVGDHLDLSYNRPGEWPVLTPGGSIRSFAFEIGDPDAGPSVQLGMVTSVEGEVLDWKHSIDPVHHHGSDQFRVVTGGEWVLANHRMPTGAFSFQEAGWVYQEHPGADTAVPAWTALLMADRRGTSATIHFAGDRETVLQVGSEFGQPMEGDAVYPHPAGHKGLAAIATSRGGCKHGYRHFERGDLQQGDVVSGLLGDPEVGPVVHVFRAAPGETIVPECTYASELLVIVVEGNCSINGKTYVAGDMRVQNADCAVGVAAGSAGAQVVLIVADRRAGSSLAHGERPAWMDDGARLRAELEVFPGGTWRKAAA